MTGTGSPPQAGGAAPRASLLDTLRVSLGVLLPVVAKGPVLRRPLVMALAEKLRADDRAVRVLQRIRARHGSRPLRLRVLGRSVTMVLSPDDVGRILAASPEPFAVANREKLDALAHFQPSGVLVSHGRVRADRRRFNEAVLDADLPLHRLAAPMATAVTEEGDRIGADARSAGHLDWDRFVTGWWRMARRVVLGRAARDDHELTDVLTALRSDANWSYLRTRRVALRERFRQRLAAYLNAPEPTSLAGALADTPATADTRPGDQVPQWLFALDSAGIVAFRALALLATHPQQAGRVRDELAGRDLSLAHDLPHLRACVLESVRLWPTTPVILRDSTVDTGWDGTAIPAGSAVAIFAPFFHRDEQVLPYADRFSPGIWLDGTASGNSALVPFSAGPGECPGRNLVLFLSSTLLATLLRRQEFRLASRAAIDPPKPLPRTLNNYALRFAVGPGE